MSVSMSTVYFLYSECCFLSSLRYVGLHRLT